MNIVIDLSNEAILFLAVAVIAAAFVIRFRR